MAAEKGGKLYRTYSVRSKIRAWTCITASLGRFGMFNWRASCDKPSGTESK